jgi:hypothetical protein
LAQTFGDRSRGDHPKAARRHRTGKALSQLLIVFDDQQYICGPLEHGNLHAAYWALKGTTQQT